MMIMITNEDDVVVKFFSHYFAFIVQHYMKGRVGHRGESL